MNFLSKIMILIFITFTFGSTLNAGWGGLKYDNYASHISNEIDKVFIKYNLCKDRRGDCQEKRLFFMNQAEPKIQIMVNSIEDYKIINEIITITINEFELAQKNGDKDLTIYLTFSRKAKNEAGFFSGLFHDDAFIVFKLQGNKDD